MGKVKEQSTGMKWVEIMIAVCAIVLFIFQVFYTEEEIKNSLLLHAVQIFFVALSAGAAVTLAVLVIKQKKKKTES